MKASQKILITGGVGFIGYHLTKKLIKDGFKIDIIDNLSRGKHDKYFKFLLRDNNVNFYNHDLSKIPEIKYNRYLFIFHLAAIVGVKNVIEKPYDVLEKNIRLLTNSISLAKKQKKLKRFFFFSTSEIYAGSLNNKIIKFPTNENNILSLNNLSNKRSTYMLSKIYGEALCHFSNLPYTIFRPHNIFGERMGMSHVIPELTKKSLRKKDTSLEVHNSNDSRCFCFIDDALQIIIKSMYSKKTLGKTYNLGDSRKEIKIYDLAKKILKILNINKKIKNKIIDNSSPKRRVPSMNKLFNDINFKLKSSFERNLKSTVLWYKDYLIKNEK